jgi:transcriptional regulator with XRE-family HTH domain
MDKDVLMETVRRLRVGLGDTQQQFANRLQLAISTVVRYELSRPPRGKALAQLKRVATDNGLDECAKVFHDALLDDVRDDLKEVEVRDTPVIRTSGLVPSKPQSEEEQRMVNALLYVMREADGPGVMRDTARAEMKLVKQGLRRLMMFERDAILGPQSVEDRAAAMIRLHRDGMRAEQIAKKLKLTTSEVQLILHMEGETQ